MGSGWGSHRAGGTAASPLSPRQTQAGLEPLLHAATSSREACGCPLLLLIQAMDVCQNCRVHRLFQSLLIGLHGLQVMPTRFLSLACRPFSEI